MTPPVACWHVENPGNQLRRHWAHEAEWVVFNQASGDLHLLNAEAIAVLDRLIAGRASIDDLCLTANTADPDAIRQVIESLDSLGLVSRLLP